MSRDFDRKFVFPQDGILVVNKMKLKEIKEKRFSIANAQFLLDFDFTITKKPWMDPNIAYNSNSPLEGLSIKAIQDPMIMSVELIDRYNNLIKEYQQSVGTKIMSFNEMKVLCDDIWSKNDLIFSQCNFSDQKLKDVIQKNKVFRIKEYFPFFISKIQPELRKNSKKLIIISAGIEQVIRVKLISESINVGMLKILANKCVGINDNEPEKASHVTPFTKNSRLVEENYIDWDAKIFFLLGDSVADSTMLDESILKEKQYVLKIGFFNKQNLHELDMNSPDLQDFTNHFDIIIFNDNDFSKVVELLD
ncbi:MAG: 7-methylguanosine phosphate-specific 5'-nucleotidase, partial [Paramarteilia canceri]